MRSSKPWVIVHGILIAAIVAGFIIAVVECGTPREPDQVIDRADIPDNEHSVLVK